MSEEIEHGIVGFKIDLEKCTGCQLGKYLSQFNVKWAKCCRNCKNINFNSDEFKTKSKNDSDFVKNKVYCTKHKMFMNFIEICDLYEKS